MPARKTREKRPQAQGKRPRTTTKKLQKTPQKAKKGRWLGIWLGLTGVAMLSATAGAILAVSLNSTPLLQTELSPEEEAVFGSEAISRQSFRLPELTRPVNILILGTKVLTSDVDEASEDVGYHALVNSFEGLSDTMLLLRFDPEDEKLTLLSIPRDTRAEIEGHGTTKINAANYYGGPALAAKSISNLLEDVPIDRYIRVNVQGVEKLIDALGGVTVYVPHDMKYQDDSQHLYINLKQGEQHLDGEKAMQFLRFRYDRLGDIGRVQRQQMLMRSLVEQTLNPATVGRVPKIIKVIQDNIDTNLSIEEIVALAGFATETDREKMQMLMVPGNFNNDGKNEESYWVPYRRPIREMMAKHFDQGYSNVETTDPAYLSVAIQDSTGSPRAIAAMKNYLQAAGYRNVYVVDDTWEDTLSVTRIIAQGGDESAASAIRADLGFGEVRVESTGSLASDVTVQLGQDWLNRQSDYNRLNSY
ncbi:MAG: LCP family protein [Oscillatoria sp. PMC 1068.18]|nr:LCP family protein [Oscillatoria sp. PMC 1076.18]MEC4990815.1 LCP family protein [Oscillatoria sp. PMC 1068.18]